MDLRMVDDSSDDEPAHFLQKALYVLPPTRLITLDTVPQDGSEFILKSRLEEELAARPNQSAGKYKLKHWAKKRAMEFGKYAVKLQKDRANLNQKFPLKYDLPEKDEKKWCKFCLGSELFDKIYDEPCDEKVEGHSPVLSIVAHIQQDMVKAVLKYLYHWFLAVGMNESVGQWAYALFACLEHPVDDRCQKFIEVFKVACRKRMKVCDPTEQTELHMIFAILDLNFNID